MNLLRRRLLAALALAPLAAGRVGAQTGRLAPPRSLGYLPWWMAPGWASLPLHLVDRVVLFDSHVRSDGSLVNRNWEGRAPGLKAYASRLGIRLEVALSLFGHAPFNRVFADPAVRERLLVEALGLLQDPYIGGLHLDFEGYASATQAALLGFRGWLAALDDARRPARKSLSAFYSSSDEFAPYDEASAARLDYCVPQLYDAHWSTGDTTGPIVTRDAANPASVARALARVTALGLPRGRILPSVPLYGWQWPSANAEPESRTLDTASLLTYAPTPEELLPYDRLVATDLARRYGLKRDAQYSPYFTYHDGARWQQGWFEDVPSLRRKLGQQRTQNYAGLAFFPLGYDGGEVMDGLLRWWRAGA